MTNLVDEEMRIYYETFDVYLDNIINIDSLKRYVQNIQNSGIWRIRMSKGNFLCGIEIEVFHIGGEVASTIVSKEILTDTNLPEEFIKDKIHQTITQIERKLNNPFSNGRN